jgi:hypothetical protein
MRKPIRVILEVTQTAPNGQTQLISHFVSTRVFLLLTNGRPQNLQKASFQLLMRDALLWL